MADTGPAHSTVKVEIEFTEDTEQKIRAIVASEIDNRLQQLHLVPVDLTADKPFR